MGAIKDHPPVKLIIGMTYNPRLNTETVISTLENQFSSVELKSDVFQFSEYTGYYQAEMGKNLQKHFVVFARLIDIEELPGIKIRTNQIEREFSEAKQRQVNLDPGYIAEAKLVLATTKNYAHRLYLQKGIFGDVHLVYQGNSFQIQPWTYPDYQQEHVIAFFNKIRQKYLHQLGDSFIQHEIKS